MAKIVFIALLIAYIVYFSYCIDRLSSEALGRGPNMTLAVAIANAASWASWAILVASFAFYFLSSNPDAWLFNAVAVACTIPVYMARDNLRKVLNERGGGAT